ncbi:hypothetical protein K435DRAFT_853745 [Dendrothele bispora CBS 962.96]|uniref:Uncharacterized protein n=1 Tax=Dendrothele bispora (strain CBS 962.96) TaxID=1314807 RepID=A0A4V4HH61_DENBC|nr:hypothetical protein K435DRAFT_853745 [Dendrothele bispora CBS 962.96]
MFSEPRQFVLFFPYLLPGFEFGYGLVLGFRFQFWFAVARGGFGITFTVTEQRHFNAHYGQLASNLSEGVLRRLAEAVDAEEQAEEEEEEEEGEEVGSNSNTGLVPPIISDFDSGLPFPFTLAPPNSHPNSQPHPLSPFGANPDLVPTNSTRLFTPPSHTPLSPFFGVNPNPHPTNSTLPFAPPPPFPHSHPPAPFPPPSVPLCTR